MVDMTHLLESSVTALLAWLAIPQVGLGAIFVIAFVSATLLPMGSEPAVFALVKLRPDLFWPAIFVATAGNTLGGAVTWWMGRGARQAADMWRHAHPVSHAHPPHAHPLATRWLQRFGPKTCLLSWLPVVGDPICAVAGWMQFPLWPCVFYMAIGKWARYWVMTSALIWSGI